MFIPIYDRNRLRFIRRQWMVLALIALNTITFLVTSVPQVGDLAVVSLGYIPAVVNDFAELSPELVTVPEEATFLTYAFLHAGWMHLGTNMLFLWVFGDNVEDATGHFRFLLLYLGSAAAGAWAHGLLIPESQQPLVGASGAVAGVTAAYLILHPRVRVWILVLYRVPLPLPAWIPLGFWIAVQFVMVVADPGGQISWAAHVGGAIAGALLIVLLKRRDAPLLDRRIDAPEAVVLEDKPPAPPPPRWGRGRNAS